MPDSKLKTPARWSVILLISLFLGAAEHLAEPGAMVADDRAEGISFPLAACFFQQLDLLAILPQFRAFLKKRSKVARSARLPFVCGVVVLASSRVCSGWLFSLLRFSRGTLPVSQQPTTACRCVSVRKDE